MKKLLPLVLATLATGCAFKYDEIPQTELELLQDDMKDVIAEQRKKYEQSPVARGRRHEEAQWKEMVVTRLEEKDVRAGGSLDELAQAKHQEAFRFILQGIEARKKAQADVTYNARKDTATNKFRDDTGKTLKKIQERIKPYDERFEGIEGDVSKKADGDPFEELVEKVDGLEEDVKKFPDTYATKDDVKREDQVYERVGRSEEPVVLESGDLSPAEKVYTLLGQLEPGYDAAKTSKGLLQLLITSKDRESILMDQLSEYKTEFPELATDLIGFTYLALVDDYKAQRKTISSKANRKGRKKAKAEFKARVQQLDQDMIEAELLTEKEIQTLYRH